MTSEWAKNQQRDKRRRKEELRQKRVDAPKGTLMWCSGRDKDGTIIREYKNRKIVKKQLLSIPYNEVKKVRIIRKYL